MIVYVNRKDSLYSFLRDYNYQGLNALEELKKEYKAHRERGRHSVRFARLFNNKNVVLDKNITVINACMYWSETGTAYLWAKLNELLCNRVDMINDITKENLVKPTNYNDVILGEDYV